MGSMYRQHGYGTNAQEVQLQHGSPTARRCVSQVPSPVTWVDILDRETGGAAFPKVADPTVWFNPQATFGCGFVSHLESPPRSGTNRDCLIGQVAAFPAFPTILQEGEKSAGWERHGHPWRTVQDFFGLPSKIRQGPMSALCPTFTTSLTHRFGFFALRCRVFFFNNVPYIYAGRQLPTNTSLFFE